MKYISILFYVIFCAVFCSRVQSAELGKEASSFNLESGDNKEISLDELKGKIIVIIYETKDVVEQNRALKNELTKLYADSDKLNSQSIILPVINCSSAFWLTKGVWQQNLCKNSDKEHITIYGDWDGKMFSDYDMQDNESNIVIIDKNGIIRYFNSGVISNIEIDNIKKLIVNLLK